MARTIKELLNERADRLADKTFLYWEDREVTYEELARRSAALASGLARLGAAPGDRVALWALNRPEYLEMMFGCAAAGVVLVPINTRFKADEAEYILRHCGARVLVAQPQYLEMVRQIGPRCPDLQEIIMLDSKTAGTGFYDDLFEPDGPADREIGEHDPAAIIYTSGTTGRPKGVVLTHGNYVANAGQLARACSMTEEDRFLCILPLFHVNGQVVTVHAPLFAGASMVLLSRFNPKELLPRLERYQATAFSAVPTVYAILNNLPDAESYNLSRLRFCICGAAPMPVDVFETFERKYKAFILEGYGLSEATCVSSMNPLDGTRKIGSIGLPIEGQEIIIVSDSGRRMESGQVGEIVVRGPNVMLGYYNDPDETAGAVRDGWLYTGDLGYRDRDGYLWIVGRKKEMIIRGGENIYPREIEDVICGHPKVEEAAVVGIPDKIWGEEVAAFVVLKAGNEAKSAELYDYCSERLADYKCPRLIFFRDRLPKAVGGKVQKNAILETYLDRK